MSNIQVTTQYLVFLVPLGYVQRKSTLQFINLICMYRNVYNLYAKPCEQKQRNVQEKGNSSDFTYLVLRDIGSPGDPSRDSRLQKREVGGVW